MYITFTDLGIFILFLLLLTVGILFIIALVNLIGLLKRVRSLVDYNTANINKSLDDLPVVMDNVKQSTGIVKDGLSKTENTIDIFSETVNSIAVTSSKAESWVNYLHVFWEVFNSVVEMFSKDTSKK